MLVYCSNLSLEVEGGLDLILPVVARWLGGKTGEWVSPALLAGDWDYRTRDGVRIISQCTANDLGADKSTFLAAVELLHPDTGGVSGRQWATEIGFSRRTESGAINCTVLLKTNEVSPRAMSRLVRVTRPRVVEHLVAAFATTPGTPGAQPVLLRPENVEQLQAMLDDRQRLAPIVFASPTEDGRSLVNPVRLQSLLAGIAHVVDVAPEFLAEGKPLVAQGKTLTQAGGVCIAFTPRKADGHWPVQRYTQATLENLLEANRSTADEILSEIAHRTNLPNSWRHISPERVQHARVQRHLSLAINKAKSAGGDVSEYVQLLEMADTEIQDKNRKIADLEEDIGELEEDVEELKGQLYQARMEADGLRQARENAASAKIGRSGDNATAIAAIVSLVDREPPLEDCLTILAALYPDRLVVLESAMNSAAKSGRFRRGRQAFHLLHTLVRDYWEGLAGGGSDTSLKGLFGNGYSAKEAETLSTAGRQRRTFVYKGQLVLMERHLKIGVKDSLSETFRAHFEWFADEQKIVIGHCGGHLDF